MNCNSSENWQMRRRGNFWILPLILLGLVILTHGWILFLPLIVLAGFALVGFVLPRMMWHMREGEWQSSGWQEKRKRSWDDEPKRKHDDYV